jgi:peroxiredoxin Q/BCP
MKRLAAALVLSALVVGPASAALDKGAKAPDFTAPGFQAGKPLTFSLAQARKKGPVVLYFFPAADTPGCNIEAKMFADAIPQFTAAGATVIGVTAGKLEKLQQVSADNDKCSGKFPVAADAGAKIARQYDSVLPAGISSRTSYVIAPSGEIVHVYSKMDPSEHVAQTLGAVKAWKVSHKR